MLPCYISGAVSAEVLQTDLPVRGSRSPHHPHPSLRLSVSREDLRGTRSHRRGRGAPEVTQVTDAYRGEMSDGKAAMRSHSDKMCLS